MNGATSYPRSDGDTISEETLAELVAAGYLTAEEVLEFLNTMFFKRKGFFNSILRMLLQIKFKNLKNDPQYLDQVNSLNIEKDLKVMGKDLLWLFIIILVENY